MIFGLLDTVDDANIGMIESGSCSCFAEESLFVPRAEDQVRGKKFQSNCTLELQVERFVHHTHPAGTELLGDAVVRNGLTDHTAGERR